MNKPILMLCDSEEEYALGLMKYLYSRADMPFEVHTFTNMSQAGNFLEKVTPNCLIATQEFFKEDRYQEAFREKELTKFMLTDQRETSLEESDQKQYELKTIYKYQSAEVIWREVLYSCLQEETTTYFPHRDRTTGMKIIGIYSPVHRCLQTTFAVTLGQLLAKHHSTLYLNFEFYSGLSFLINREFHADLSDLAYFYQCAREKFSIKLSSLTEKIGNLDFIPPVMSYPTLKEIPKKLWIEIFKEIEHSSNYEYLILDLTEAIDGVFDILRECDYVYTICKEEPVAQNKLKQYEAVVMQMEYEDVRAKTKKIHFPLFRKLPINPQEFGIGEMADYIREHILEDLDGNN